MCGIAAEVYRLRPLLDERKTLDALHHRGPDSRGWKTRDYSNHRVQLGHTRLSIVDLSSAGQQPMASRNGRWLLTYNGEIYNHLEIRRDLPGLFRGHSDTETLVEAIALWGVPETLQRLVGMYAFAALETASGRLWVARDSFGIKPIYVRHRPGEGLAVASELRALTTDGPPTVDSKGLDALLTLRFVPSPHTLFAGMTRVPPGHYLRYSIENDAVETVCFRADRPRHQFVGSVQDAAQAYIELCEQATKRQLMADVPVGILLSAGIDSALIAALARRHTDTLPCFTVGFGSDYPECELADAADTADTLRLRHVPLQVSPDDLWLAVGRTARAVEEPIGTTSILPMSLLVEKAREQVTVVLTGQGADEPWGGYRRYQAEAIRSRLPWAGAWASLAVSAQAGARLVDRPLPDVLERGLGSMACARFGDRFREGHVLFTTEERLRLTGRSESQVADDAIAYWIQWLAGGRTSDGLASMMKMDTRMNLSDDLLIYGDKTSMAVSLEARVPFLDDDLVAFVESLPLSHRVAINRTKIAHRLAATQVLPRSIIDRPKRGFQVPFGSYIRQDWKEKVEPIILHESTLDRIGLDKDAVGEIWQTHQVGKKDRSRQLFTLLMASLIVSDAH